MLINLATVWAELAEAGIDTNGLSLGEDGVIIAWASEAQRAAVQAVLDAHDPSVPAPPSRVLTRVQFLGRLTPQEWAAAVTSPMPEVMYFVELVRAAQEIDLDDAQTQAGLQVAVAAGVLSSERADEILGG